MTRTSVTLSHLDGRKWAWTQFGAGSTSGQAWEWIAEQIAAEFECNEDDVGADELPDGREVVTVRGEPVMVYRLSRVEARALLMNNC